MNERAEQEIDLSTLWAGIRRRLWWVLGVAVIAAVLVWLWSHAQPSMYESSAVIIADNTQGQDALLGSALVRAQPLPEGTLQQALQSTEVLLPLIRSVQADALMSAAERTRLVNQLTRELRSQQLRTIQLTSQTDTSGNGTYTLTTQARTAVAAAQLTGLTTQALLNWDSNRALSNVRRAQNAFRAQLGQIDSQLTNAALPDVERETLVARRATTQQSLAQTNILAGSASGVLSLLSAAVQPLDPVAPKPLRNAVLTGVLLFLLSLGVAALLTVLDRTVNTEDDLLSLNVATLGVVPRLRRRDIVFSGIVRAARQAGLYEAIGFLRINLITLFQGKSHPVLLVSSTAPGEGKSSLTATLADGFAASGQRVLIIEADLYRGTQVDVWKKFGDQTEWRQLVGADGARSTQEAFRAPENVQVWRVEENIDLLPVGSGQAGAQTGQSANVFNQADIGAALSLWKQNYDLILIDSAPLLALADGLIIAPHTDGVLMVIEQGKTSSHAVRNALRRAERAGTSILGFVINKSSVRQDSNYGYDYRPRELASPVRGG